MIVCFLLDWQSFVLGAGADFVMLGGMFAGHDQSGKSCLRSFFILNATYK